MFAGLRVFFFFSGNHFTWETLLPENPESPHPLDINPKVVTPNSQHQLLRGRPHSAECYFRDCSVWCQDSSNTFCELYQNLGIWEQIIWCQWCHLVLIRKMFELSMKYIDWITVANSNFGVFTCNSCTYYTISDPYAITVYICRTSENSTQNSFQQWHKCQHPSNTNQIKFNPNWQNEVK